jgi:hypothetical protein
MKHVATGFVFSCAVLIAGLAAAAEEPAIPEPDFTNPGTLIRGLYNAVSSELGSEPDWDLVRSFFHPDAVIVLRASPEASEAHDVDGFIENLQGFYERIDPAENVFEETILSIQIQEYGNIAWGYVVYEAAVTTSEHGPQRGFDAWHLMKDEGRWWAVSVVNENERAAGDIPVPFFADEDEEAADAPL